MLFIPLGVYKTLGLVPPQNLLAKFTNSNLINYVDTFTGTDGEFINGRVLESGNGTWVNDNQQIIFNNTLADGLVDGSNFHYSTFEALPSASSFNRVTLQTRYRVYVTNVQGSAGLTFFGSVAFPWFTGAQGYSFILYNQDATLYRQDDGSASFVVLDTVPFAFSVGDEYDMRVEVTGDLIECYLDDVLILSATDSNYRGRWMGLYHSYTAAAAYQQTFFYDFSATVEEESQTSNEITLSWTDQNLNEDGYVFEALKSNNIETINYIVRDNFDGPAGTLIQNHTPNIIDQDVTVRSGVGNLAQSSISSGKLVKTSAGGAAQAGVIYDFSDPSVVTNCRVTFTGILTGDARYIHIGTDENLDSGIVFGWGNIGCSIRQNTTSGTIIDNTTWSKGVENVTVVATIENGVATMDFNNGEVILSGAAAPSGSSIAVTVLSVTASLEIADSVSIEEPQLSPPDQVIVPEFASSWRPETAAGQDQDWFPNPQNYGDRRFITYPSGIEFRPGKFLAQSNGASNLTNNTPNSLSGAPGDVYSVSAVAQINDDSLAFQEFCQFSNGSDDAFLFRLRAQGPNLAIRVGFFNSSLNRYPIQWVDPDPIPEGEPTQITMSLDYDDPSSGGTGNATAYIYKNGLPAAIEASVAPLNFGGTSSTSTIPTFLGRRGSNFNPSGAVGWVTEWGLDRLLTPEEVLAYYQDTFDIDPTPFLPGPEAFWEMETLGTVVDETGNGHDLEVRGSSALAAGVGGGNGIDTSAGNALLLSPDEAWLTDDEDFSMFLFAEPTGNSSAIVVWRTAYGSINANVPAPWNLFYNSTTDPVGTAPNAFSFAIGGFDGTNNSTVGDPRVSTETVPLNTKNSIYFHWKKATKEIAISINNGPLITDTIGYDLPINRDAVGPTDNLRMGGLTAAFPNSFEGVLDKVSYFGRTLTSEERTFLHNNGDGRAWEEIDQYYNTEWVEVASVNSNVETASYLTQAVDPKSEIVRGYAWKGTKENRSDYAYVSALNLNPVTNLVSTFNQGIPTITWVDDQDFVTGYVIERFTSSWTELGRVDANTKTFDLPPESGTYRVAPLMEVPAASFVIGPYTTILIEIIPDPQPGPVFSLENQLSIDPSLTVTYGEPDPDGGNNAVTIKSIPGANVGEAIVEWEIPAEFFTSEIIDVDILISHYAKLVSSTDNQIPDIEIRAANNAFFRGTEDGGYSSTPATYNSVWSQETYNDNYTQLGSTTISQNTVDNTQFTVRFIFEWSASNPEIEFTIYNFEITPE